MNIRLTELLVCPICKGKLQLDKKQNELICRFDRLAFPIRNNIPVMLQHEARELAPEEANG